MCIGFVRVTRQDKVLLADRFRKMSSHGFDTPGQAVGRLQSQVLQEAVVDRATYDHVQSLFYQQCNDSPNGVQCVLVDPVWQMVAVVEVKYRVRTNQTMWRMDLDEEQVNSLLGVTILRDTYGSMEFTSVEACIPPLCNPALYFYHIAGKDLSLKGWRQHVSHYPIPNIGRGLYFKEQVSSYTALPRNVTQFPGCNCVSLLCHVQVVHTDNSMPMISLLLPTSLADLPSIHWLKVEETQKLVQQCYAVLGGHEAREFAREHSISITVPQYKRISLKCATCGKCGHIMLCARCGSAGYCSPECQKTAFPSHKFACKAAEVCNTQS